MVFGTRDSYMDFCFPSDPPSPGELEDKIITACSAVLAERRHAQGCGSQVATHVPFKPLLTTRQQTSAFAGLPD